MGADAETGTTSDALVGIDSDVRLVRSLIFLAAVIAKAHGTNTNAPIAITALYTIDANNGSEFSHRKAKKDYARGHYYSMNFALCAPFFPKKGKKQKQPELSLRLSLTPQTSFLDVRQ
jgi:hypothetical protein